MKQFPTQPQRGLRPSEAPRHLPGANPQKVQPTRIHFSVESHRLGSYVRKPFENTARRHITTANSPSAHTCQSCSSRPRPPFHFFSSFFGIFRLFSPPTHF